MSAPDHEPHRSRRFLLLLKGRPHMSQSFPTLGLRANCALPNLPRLNQRYGFDRLRTSTYNQKLDRAAFSRSSPIGRKSLRQARKYSAMVPRKLNISRPVGVSLSTFSVSERISVS